MIFTVNPAGSLTHVGQEWTRLTGQDVAAALNDGWLSCIHDEDRRIVQDLVRQAVAAAAEFSVRFRLCSTDGSRRWIGAGGVPSFGPPNHTFLGYLGSMTELIPDAAAAARASGSLGHFTPPPTHAATSPDDYLERIADHLLIAHSMIEGDGVKTALPGLRQALHEVGRALATKVESARVLN